jgi:hypothetical protein
MPTIEESEMNLKIGKANFGKSMFEVGTCIQPETQQLDVPPFFKH